MPGRWHFSFVTLSAVRFSIALVALTLLSSSACDAEAPCLPTRSAAPSTYQLDVHGFPEFAGEPGFDGGEYKAQVFEGPCSLDALEFDGAETLSLELSCSHPEVEGAGVSLTVSADGIPEGLETGQTIDFAARVGADHPYGVNDSRHTLSDELGVVFAASRGGVSATLGAISISAQNDCPQWEACRGGDSYSGYIRSSFGDDEEKVHIGDVGVLVHEAHAWDVSLFQARFDGSDCHSGPQGSASLLRRP